MIVFSYCYWELNVIFAKYSFVNGVRNICNKIMLPSLLPHYNVVDIRTLSTYVAT